MELAVLVICLKLLFPDGENFNYCSVRERDCICDPSNEDVRFCRDTDTFSDDACLSMMQNVTLKDKIERLKERRATTTTRTPLAEGDEEDGFVRFFRASFDYREAAILALTFLVLVSVSGCLLSVLLYRKGPAACKRFRMRRNGRPSHSVLMRLRDIESANREIRRLTKDLRRATDEAASAFGVFAEDAAAAAATRGHAVEAGETGREAQAGESTGLLNETFEPAPAEDTCTITGPAVKFRRGQTTATATKDWQDWRASWQEVQGRLSKTFSRSDTEPASRSPPAKPPRLAKAASLDSGAGETVVQLHSAAATPSRPPPPPPTTTVTGASQKKGPAPQPGKDAGAKRREQFRSAGLMPAIMEEIEMADLQSWSAPSSPPKARKQEQRTATMDETVAIQILALAKIAKETIASLAPSSAGRTEWGGGEVTLEEEDEEDGERRYDVPDHRGETDQGHATTPPELPALPPSPLPDRSASLQMQQQPPSPPPPQQQQQQQQQQQ